MPKAKPVSLHPLSFDEAISAIMRVNSGNTKIMKKPAKPSKRQTIQRSRKPE